jgi:hypothetical protein
MWGAQSHHRQGWRSSHESTRERQCRRCLSGNTSGDDARFGGRCGALWGGARHYLRLPNCDTRMRNPKVGHQRHLEPGARRKAVEGHHQRLLEGSGCGGRTASNLQGPPSPARASRGGRPLSCRHPRRTRAHPHQSARTSAKVFACSRSSPSRERIGVSQAFSLAGRVRVRTSTSPHRRIPIVGT